MINTEIQIKIYNGTESHSAVYVLGRGQNSGKPLDKPCPNCYKIQAPTDCIAKVRAVAHILFVSGKLRPFMRGSVFEFITVGSYRKAFLQLWHSLDSEKIFQTAQMLQHLEQQADNLKKQIRLVNQLRQNIAFAALEWGLQNGRTTQRKAQETKTISNTYSDIIFAHGQGQSPV